MINERSSPSSLSVAFWILVTFVATVGIVFTNKAIFTDPKLVKMPVSFAAFHFSCTSVTLFFASKFGVFEPKPLGYKAILPICVAFCAYVLLTNLSLAYSSVVFYQLVRILISPFVVLINRVVYGTSVSRLSAMLIGVTCSGVGITVYFDAISATSNRTTTAYGAFMAFAGVFASAVYTIWIGSFAKHYQCSSMQLLFNQAPVSVLLLLCAAPFIDTFQPLDDVPRSTIYLIFFSGFLAVLINVSQFFIVHGTSALSSTIVGHAKTMIIIAFGWFFGSKMNANSIPGIFIALVGIISYSLQGYISDWLATGNGGKLASLIRGRFTLFALILFVPLFLFHSSDAGLSDLVYQVDGQHKVLYTIVVDEMDFASSKFHVEHIRILRERSSFNKHFQIQCSIITSASYGDIPGWVKEVTKNDECDLLIMHNTSLPLMLKSLQSHLLRQSGIEFIFIATNQIAIDETSFDLEKLLDLAVVLNLSVTSPAITNSIVKEFQPAEDQTSKQVGRILNGFKVGATLFSIRAFECFQTLIDTEFPHISQGYLFHGYCSSCLVATIDVVTARKGKDSSVKNDALAMVEAWKRQRDISLSLVNSIQVLGFLKYDK